jgi:crotonobetainyl-CoA:carnitine CoA-transferase CaiB-like acyl-CoA transferase
MKQALEGLKVVELGNILAGPFCGTILADFGAEVIKVEPPGVGDLMRGMGRIPDIWFAVEARNKKNITLDIRNQRGKQLLTELLRDADIVIENFRPGVFAKLGFSWERLQEINPRLIYVCSSGYGQTGPYSRRPSLDRIGLATGGLLHITGFPDGAPIKPGVSVADFMTAMFGCIGAMFAVYSRDVLGTGKGQMIDCCLSETVLRFQESVIAEYSYDGEIRERIGNAALVTSPAGHFLTKDNQYLILTVVGDKVFSQFAKAINREDLLDNPKYNNAKGRMDYRDELNQIAADWAQLHSLDECLSLLGDEVPCSKVFNVVDIMNFEQFKFREDIIKVATKQFGTISMQNVVPKLSGTPGKVNWAGEELGRFNKEIFCDRLGLSPQELEQLKADGVI